MNGASESRCRARRRNRSPLGGALVSLLIILVGVGMLLDNLGILNGRDIWEYLPCLLIAYGVIRIIDAGNRPGGLVLGTLIAGGGTLWLLDNLDVIRFNRGMIWPFILIALGVTTLVRTLERQARAGAPLADPAAGDSSDSVIWQWAFFGGSRRAVKSIDFRGGEVLSIFSGITLDLRQAKIAGDRAILDTTAVFAGIDIKVPQEWTVIVKGVGIFGAYDEKTVHPPSGPELEIRGAAVFGGVSIRN
jgi:hypothetical protein